MITVQLFGGPADGQTYTKHEKTRFIDVPLLEPGKPYRVCSYKVVSPGRAEYQGTYDSSVPTGTA